MFVQTRLRLIIFKTTRFLLMSNSRRHEPVWSNSVSNVILLVTDASKLIDVSES